jgi:hypothetical protein
MIAMEMKAKGFLVACLKRLASRVGMVQDGSDLNRQHLLDVVPVTLSIP